MADHSQTIAAEQKQREALALGSLVEVSDLDGPMVDPGLAEVLEAGATNEQVLKTEEPQK